MVEITDAGINWILISVPKLSFNTSGDNHNTVITTPFFFHLFSSFCFVLCYKSSTMLSPLSKSQNSLLVNFNLSQDGKKSLWFR